MTIYLVYATCVMQDHFITKTQVKDVLYIPVKTTFINVYGMDSVLEPFIEN